MQGENTLRKLSPILQCGMNNPDLPNAGLFSNLGGKFWRLFMVANYLLYCGLSRMLTDNPIKSIEPEAFRIGGPRLEM